MGFIGPIGVISNLYVIVGYLRNKTVSAATFQSFNWYRIHSSVILIQIDIEIIVRYWDIDVADTESTIFWDPLPYKQLAIDEAQWGDPILMLHKNPNGS